MAEATYGMNYSNFIGVDVSSDPRVVARNRLAHSVNMWRDYESEQGAAIETFPGFRRVFGRTESVIRQIWNFKGNVNNYIIVANDEWIYAINVNDEYKPYNLYASYGASEMVGFFANNSFYILGTFADANGSWKGFLKIYETSDGVLSVKRESAYIPTTYYNGKPYEQRNAFVNTVMDKYQGGGTETVFKNGEGDNAENVNVISFNINDNIVATRFPADVYRTITSVKVAGVEYSHPKLGEDDSFFRFSKENGKFKNEYIVLHSGRESQKYGHESYATSIIIPKEKISGQLVEITYNVEPTHFNTIGNLVHFQNDKVTMAEAILGCTKSAVYDGRVFLTGNPDLPNTVFYSQRNLTGANDPTYFGVYNYFNDGDGNTPNVDMLAMPNMLMVIKRDTTQDGSIYYHVGADNPHSDESVRNLVPRIYPSSTGAAGLGSAGLTDAYSLSCNFLDDPVFLSRRGLEGITKEQLNAERTVQHRSSTINRFLIKEDLAHASLAEWKGYLVVCCNGHIYLADSRTKTQNAYGSFQYEWFYLEGVGTYEEYGNVYSKLTEWPLIGDKSLEDIVRDAYELWDEEGEVEDITYNGVHRVESTTIGDIEVYYYSDPSENTVMRVLDIIPDKKVGTGAFYGAKRVLAIGELLFFATDYDICLFNTDKRGEQIYLKDDDGNYVYDEKGKKIIFREVDSDKIDSSWYSFNGVPYLSGCSIRLDDCEKKTVTKANVYGTTVARFKMIPGSRCKIKSSINGRDWKKIGEGYISRFNFEDFRFDDASFTENEDGVFVFPEASRGWVSKQYYFYSDGFCEPFGLYELSYNYKIVGKIRR